MVSYKAKVEQLEKQIADLKNKLKIPKVPTDPKGIANSILDNIDKVPDVALMTYLSWASNQLGFPVIWGALGYKLATTPVGDSNIKMSLLGVEVPVNSQTVGIMMLGALGLAPLFEGMGEWVEEKTITHWESLESCDAKRDYANLVLYSRKTVPEYMQGWADVFVSLGKPRALGTKYQECKAQEEETKIQEEKIMQDDTGKQLEDALNKDPSRADRSKKTRKMTVKGITYFYVIQPNGNWKRVTQLTYRNAGGL